MENNSFSWSAASNHVEYLLRDVIKELKIQDEFDNNGLQQKIKRCHELTFAQNVFLDAVIPQESELQSKIAKETLADPILGKSNNMLSGNQVGQLLKMVAEMISAKSILEIGTYTGYGSVTLAETTFCEELITLDNNEYCQEFLQKQIMNTPLENKIRIVIGAAMDSLHKLRDEGKSFDLVFIDADKSSYLNYYKFILDNNLLNPRGVILCDNVLWCTDTFMEKSSIQGQALHDFVQFVKNDDRVEQMIYPFRDGVMLIRSK